MQTPGTMFPGNMFERSFLGAFGTWFRKDRRRRGQGLYWRILHLLRRCLGLPPRKVRRPPKGSPPEAPGL